MMRESMSRPAPSVPSVKRHDPPVSHTGGAFTASRNCSIGECGAMKSASSAIATTIATIDRPKTAPLFSRNAAQKAANGVGAEVKGGARSPGASASAVRSAPMSDPRVDRAIEHVDHHVDDNDDQRHK